MSFPWKGSPEKRSLADGVGRAVADRWFGAGVVRGAWSWPGRGYRAL